MMNFYSRSRATVVRSLVCALVLAAGSSAAYGQCSGYSITSSTGAAIDPGTVNIGNAGDDVVTPITLPFPVNLYGTSYSSANVSGNGNIQFVTAANAYGNVCLPTATTGVSMLAHWDDLRTDGIAPGIFTSVTGVAPNRVFNIEWRAVYFSATSTALNFEVRLFEDNSRFEYVYGANPQAGSGATVGVQSGSAANQFSCNASNLSSGLKLTFMPVSSSTVLCTSGGANPLGVNNCTAATSLLSVQVNPATPASTGLTVVANLTSIGGSATQAFYDDGTHGDVTAGDLRFSYQATIAPAVTAGSKSISYSASDLEGRVGSGTLSVAVNCVTAPHPILGPDVYTFAVTDVPRWGTNAAGTVTAYSVGTTSSNQGDHPVLWIDSNAYLPDYDTTQHPVISQNMYRLKTYGTAPNQYTRFEQLGQSWLKHGFTSTNSACNPVLDSIWRPSTQTYLDVGGDVLAVNCTDTYGGGLNGSQSLLGPKNLVNATLGTSAFVRGTATGDTDSRARLQVPTADVASQPAGTRFYVDAFYVTGDDAQFVLAGQTVAVNALNNASWRELNAAQINTGTSVGFAAATQLRNPGIFAWRAADPTVTLVTADHDDTPNPGTGIRDNSGNPSFPGTFIRSRYWVAAKVTALPGGLYRYEYAVYNHNSDRSAQKVSFPVPAGATVSDVTFHAPMWHSGEPYSNAAWTSSRSGNTMTFATELFSANANANALRWACLYNFGFTTNVAPTTGAATIGLFKPGVGVNPPAAINATGLPVPTTPVQCGPADVGSQGGEIGADGQLDNNDFVAFIQLFFDQNASADLGVQGGAAGQDGLFDNNDFIAFIDAFFTGC